MLPFKIFASCHWLCLTNPNHSSDLIYSTGLTNPYSDKEIFLHSPRTLRYFLWGSFSSSSVPNLMPTTGLHFSVIHHLLLSISSCCLTCSCSYTRIFSIPISSQNSLKTSSSTFENREMEQKNDYPILQLTDVQYSITSCYRLDF